MILSNNLSTPSYISNIFLSFYEGVDLLTIIYHHNLDLIIMPLPRNLLWTFASNFYVISIHLSYCSFATILTTIILSVSKGLPREALISLFIYLLIEICSQVTSLFLNVLGLFGLVMLRLLESILHFWHAIKDDIPWFYSSTSHISKFSTISSVPSLSSLVFYFLTAKF